MHYDPIDHMVLVLVEFGYDDNILPKQWWEVKWSKTLQKEYDNKE